MILWGYCYNLFASHHYLSTNYLQGSHLSGDKTPGHQPVFKVFQGENPVYIIWNSYWKWLSNTSENHDILVYCTWWPLSISDIFLIVIWISYVILIHIPLNTVINKLLTETSLNYETSQLRNVNTESNMHEHTCVWYNVHVSRMVMKCQCWHVRVVSQWASHQACRITTQSASH